jgi:hypothetical protein
METDKNDILIRSFLIEKKVEIADNHFTQRVLRRLPERRTHTDWLLVLFAGMGTLLCVVLGWDYQLPQFSITLPGSINYYYILGAVFSFPLLSLLGYGFSKIRNLSWL